MTDRTVRVRLEAIISGYQAKMAEAGQSTKALEARVSGFRTQMKGADLTAGGLFKSLASLSAGELAVGAAAAVGAALMVKAVKSGINAYVNLADEVRNVQRVSGASAEQSSILVERAKALGVNTDSLATSLFRLSQNVVTNGAELAKYGVEIERNNDGSVNLVKTLDSVRDAYQRAGAGQEANRLTQLALSRGAIQLLPLLGATRDRLNEIDAAGRAHHMILSQQDLDRVLDYKIATHELGDAWRGVEQELARGVLPRITELSKDLTGIIESIDKLTKTPDWWPKALKDQGTPGKRPIDWLAQHEPGKDWPGEQSLWHALGAHTEAQTKAADSTRATNAAMALQQVIAQQDAAAIKDYSDTLDLAFAATFDVTSATDKFESGLAGAYTKINAAKAAGNAYATSLSTSTTTGLENRSMLQGLALDLDTAAKKYKEQHPEATDTEIHAALKGQIDQFSTLLTYFSGDNAEAKKLRDMLGEIAGLDLSKPGKTYKLGWGLGSTIANPFAKGGVSSDAPSPAPPTDTSTKDLKAGETALNDYLKAVYEQRIAIQDNMFKDGKISIQAYLRDLDEQLSHEVAYSEKWQAIQDKKRAALDQLAAFYSGVVQHEQELEDNRYAAGVLATDQYLALLRKRLAGLEQYSNEWMSVYRQIQQIEGDALDAQIALIQAVDAQRQFDAEFYGLAGQRTLNMSTGSVQHHATGGYIYGAGQGDSVPMYGTAGEYVINKQAAGALGPSTLAMLNKGLIPAGGGFDYDRMARAAGAGKVGKSAQFHSHVHVTDWSEVPRARREGNNDMRARAFLMGY